MVVGAISVVAAVIIGWVAWERLFRRHIPEYADLAEHFKYGAIGNHAATGLPFPIWSVLPEICQQHLPRPGGYEVFGFLFEDGRDVPVGLSKARVGFERVAINCSLCHVTSVRFSPSEQPMLVLAGTSQTFDIQRYQRFLAACAADSAFDPDVILPAVEERFKLDWLDRLLYRFLIVDLTKKGILEQGESFAWTYDNPEWGPGRIDPFNPVKFGMLGLPVDGTIGNSDMQPVWNLDAREDLRPGAPLHWDGLNTSVREVIVSSALGDGAVADEFDWASMDKLEAFLRTVRPPPYPGEIDRELAARGERVFAETCAECHAVDGRRTLTVIPGDEVGTDANRLAMWSDQARDAYLAYDEGYDWGFQSFQNVEGWVAEPLWGIWLRAPYLHNGSVPTLADMLQPPDQRPKAFVRGTDLFDAGNVGFAAPPCDPVTHQGPGFCFDTSLPGNANTGHLYGTDLPEADKAALRAFLLTL